MLTKSELQMVKKYEKRIKQLKKELRFNLKAITDDEVKMLIDDYEAIIDHIYDRR